MDINVLDKSKYLKGLLVLSRKDNYLSKKEREILKQVGKSLGFEKRFIESAINDLMVNEYLTEEPPKFSGKFVAESFIKNGVLLAISDGKLDKREIEFLWNVALINNISKEEFQKILTDFNTLENNQAILDELFETESVA